MSTINNINISVNLLVDKFNVSANKLQATINNISNNEISLNSSPAIKSLKKVEGQVTDTGFKVAKFATIWQGASTILSQAGAIIGKVSDKCVNCHR